MQLIEAMAVLHERKIAHRGKIRWSTKDNMCLNYHTVSAFLNPFSLPDLKPENLLLKSKTDDTSILLADFGFARHVPKEGLRTRCGTVRCIHAIVWFMTLVGI